MLLDGNPLIGPAMIDQCLAAHVSSPQRERQLLDRRELGLSPGGKADAIHRGLRLPRPDRGE
jgi:hypothetical protein